MAGDASWWIISRHAGDRKARAQFADNTSNILHSDRSSYCTFQLYCNQLNFAFIIHSYIVFVKGAVSKCLRPRVEP